MLSPFETNKYYVHIGARSFAMQRVGVPADGDCFFHAVALALIRATGGTTRAIGDKLRAQMSDAVTLDDWKRVSGGGVYRMNMAHATCAFVNNDDTWDAVAHDVSLWEDTRIETLAQLTHIPPLILKDLERDAFDQIKSHLEMEWGDPIIMEFVADYLGCALHVVDYDTHTPVYRVREDHSMHIVLLWIDESHFELLVMDDVSVFDVDHPLVALLCQ